MDDIDQEAANYFAGLSSRLRAQRISKRLGARSEPQHCEDCKKGVCPTHMKDEDAALFEEGESTTESAEGAPPQE